jgi:transcription initiation factor IIE alpha subunit
MIGKIQKRRLSKKKDNGYLICNNCGENYFLKEGETSDDFSECDCGGKFDYKKPFKAYKKSEDLNKSSIRIRIIAIALGAVIYLVPFSFFVPISGFVASYMAGGRYRDGIVNSAVACYIGGLIYFFSGYIGYSAYSLNNVSDFGIVLIIDIILAIIGGIIGIYIKNRRIDKGVLKGVFACNKCKSYYELPLGETNEDYDLICECGSKIKQAKKTSLIVLVIGYIFAISGGLIGLFIGTYLYSRENPNAKFHGRNIIVIAIISIILGLFLILLYPNYLLY